MDLPCPYNCGFVYDIYDPLEGRRLLECPECGKPWILEVSYIPFIERRKVEGYSEHIPTEHEIEEDAKYFSEHPEELESGQNTTTNEQNIEESEQKPDNQNMCSKCGFVFEDHNIAPEGICPVCSLDDDSVKRLSDEGNIAAAEIAEKGNSCLLDPEAFQDLTINTHVSYRISGEYVDLKYNSGFAIRTSLADIYGLVEELGESENITPSIKQLLGDVTSRQQKTASINAFVRAVAAGEVDV